MGKLPITDGAPLRPTAKILREVGKNPGSFGSNAI
jgi:hypothetical protein